MQVFPRLAVGVCVALLASTCNDPRSNLSWLAAPTPQPTTAPTPTLYAVTGVVSEGARPIEGANVSAYIDRGRRLGYNSAVLTDAAGRYELTNFFPQST